MNRVKESIKRREISANALTHIRKGLKKNRESPKIALFFYLCALIWLLTLRAFFTKTTLI